MWGRLPHKKRAGPQALPFFLHPSAGCVSLELDPQRQLDLTAGGARPGNLTEVRICASAAGESRTSGVPEVGPVHNVEELGPELNLGRLTHRKALVNREIQAGRPRTDSRVAPHVSKNTYALAGAGIAPAWCAIGKRNR